MSENEKNDREIEREKGSAIAEGARGPESKPPRKKRKRRIKAKKRSRKDWIIIGVSSAVIVAVIASGAVFLFGSAFQVPTSDNPTGWYTIEVYGGGFGDYDYDIEIHNASGVIKTLAVQDGDFHSYGSNRSGVFRAFNQSYAVIFQSGYKTVYLPIECSESPDNPTVNYVRPQFRAISSMVSETMEVASAGINNYTDFDPASGMRLYSKTSYKLFTRLEMDDLYSHVQWTGGQTNVSDYVISSMPIADGSGFNTDAHLLVFNGTLVNVSYSNSYSRPHYISHESVNYTVFTLPMLFVDGDLVFEMEFDIESGDDTCILGCCITDGFIDAVFDDDYDYYKIGGF